MELENDGNLTREELFRLLRDARKRISELEENASSNSVELEHEVETRLANMTLAVQRLERQVIELKQVEAVLRDSERRYREVVEYQTELINRHLPDGTLTFVNEALCRYFGKDREELIGKSYIDFLPPEDREALIHLNEAVTQANPVYTTEHKVMTSDARVCWQQWRNRAIFDDAGRLIEYQSVGRDITDLKRAEEALRESEERFRRLVELSPYGIGIAHRGVAVFVNPALVRMLRANTAEDIIGKAILDFVHPDLRAEAEEHIRQVAMHGEAVQFAQQKLVTLDGGIVDVEVTAIPFRFRHEPAVQAVFNDVTARNSAEMDLKASLREKEVLLREIHHRVKNNFAVIASLLNMQSRYASSELVRMSFQDALARIRSMALAHRFLYLSPSLSELSTRKYLTDLVGHVVESSYTSGLSMRVKTEIADTTIGPDTAIPLGFIVAELMTNCAKHAFPQGKSGEVNISLGLANESEALLRVSDNGVGIPEDVDLRNPKSLGLDLVATFVSQLQGKIEIHRDNGTDIRIRFKRFQNQES